MILARSTIDVRHAQQLTTEVGAKVLLAMAVTLQAHLMKRLNVSNPKPYTTPSVPGEFLRKRTGWLQAHIVYEPTTAAEVARLGRVRVGYGKSAFYGAVWETKPAAQKRKGLLDALDEIKPQLLQMAGMMP